MKKSLVGSYVELKHPECYPFLNISGFICSKKFIQEEMKKHNRVFFSIENVKAMSEKRIYKENTDSLQVFNLFFEPVINSENYPNERQIVRDSTLLKDYVLRGFTCNKYTFGRGSVQYALKRSKSENVIIKSDIIINSNTTINAGWEHGDAYLEIDIYSGPIFFYYWVPLELLKFSIPKILLTEFD